MSIEITYCVCGLFSLSRLECNLFKDRDLFILFADVF